MSRWKKRCLSPVIEHEATTTNTERSALLWNGVANGEKQSRTYYSITVPNTTNQETLGEEQKTSWPYSQDGPNTLVRHASSSSDGVNDNGSSVFPTTKKIIQRIVLFIAATLVLIIVATGFTHRHVRSRWIIHHKPFWTGRDKSNRSSSSLDKIVYAYDVAQPCTSFAELAQAMLPAWYTLLWTKLPILSMSLMPEDVYKTRKIMLKTRDLLDIFSPVYPNRTSIQMSTTTTGSQRHQDQDLFILIRKYLDEGYTKVGEFQDLHNAHVIYSHDQLNELREIVLEWKKDFEAFDQTHNVTQFLATPTPTGSYHHKKESRLFWNANTTLPNNKQHHPFGNDMATFSLQMVGTRQLSRSLMYLRLAYPYESVLQERAHEHFHNLRKELRSLADEFELFQWVMFPMTSETNNSFKVLKSARKRLGDINDDWTAYTIYVENNEYHKEQKRLANRINASWVRFKQWTKEVNLHSILHLLKYSMSSTISCPRECKKQMNGTCADTVSRSQSPMSLKHFLKARKMQPTSNFVIGNEAGDADTIISAITLAYVESMAGKTQKTPIVAIPKTDFETQRPEVNLLLQLAGVSITDLLFVDDPRMKSNKDTSNCADVTLVDHNVLSESLVNRNWTVVEIVDHHQDKKQYLDSCSGVNRTIAFADNHALVASACTLVSERLKETWDPSSLYPMSLGVLLMGGILLDSVNLSPEVGKVTQRDIDAIENLRQRTHWQQDSYRSTSIGIRKSYPFSNTTMFFHVLQDAKYDFDFWKSLSVRDALRLDYKPYYYDEKTGSMFGISTVLMPLQDFFPKQSVMTGILDFIMEMKVDFLGIMFAFEQCRQGCHLRRQLALCGSDRIFLDNMTQFLLQSFEEDPQSSLHLLELKKERIVPKDSSTGLSIQLFKQGNVKPSRKQIGPLLLDYFRSSSAEGANR
mmetsp:Transcript_24629/g.44559  ORF Transcript_24629/g.44559 Transcript_24629/m.44559 type:complete len:921 (-) Transcript_24629:1691-4453(-)